VATLNAKVFCTIFEEYMPQFHDPIRPRDTKHKGKTPWNFQAPSYDERTSCYMDAGTHYGVGYNNPVGHDGKVKQRVPTLPYGIHMGMESDEAPRRLLNPDFHE
jgi:hypothetical protein